MTDTDREILRRTSSRLANALVDLRQCERHRMERIRQWLTEQLVPDLPAERKDALLTVLERIASARGDVPDDVLEFGDCLQYVLEALCVFDEQLAEGRE